MNHTPGKWEFDTTGNYYNADGVIRMNGVLIAKMVRQTTHKAGEVEANGALLAAAPELLEALDTLTIYAEAIMERVNYYNESELTHIYAASIPELKTTILAAKAAIAKAEGVTI